MVVRYALSPLSYPHGRAPPTGERAQATLRGRPRGRLGVVGSETAFFRDRLDGFGSTQGAGAIL